ncbi:hypothetical protein PTTG_04930 [Puccinia triticina 1-1 BBBD Race 1]|uniref:CigA protein n=2 Tax=Puccinia triticina TaxID=208348 RepID=A0A180GJV6_PUCT1|nr:hypothetical protein PTTG_04930 [Puccinia triticina 1-1 BBBD Race 1]
MRNQDLPSFHQSKGSAGLEDSSLRNTPLRSLKKRTSRRLLVIIALIASTVALLRFPPRTLLYTWTAQNVQSSQDPHLVSIRVNVKEDSRDWKSESYEMSSASSNPYYQPKSAHQFDEVPGDRKPPQSFHASSSRVDQVVDPANTDPAEAQSSERKGPLPIFERLIVKEAPNKPYKPLPRMRFQPNLRYENVRPSVHHLTKELEGTKFLTFLPHSGFHNQRIEMKNAFKLAKLLNRTLILPPFRLGHPLRWANSTLLSHALEEDEKKYERLSECSALHSASRRGPVDEDKSSLLEECKYDSDWTTVQVDYILNTKELYKKVPIIDRTDLREAWLWNTLKLYPGEWLEVKDEFRYSYQVYESTTAASVAESKYTWRLNIDDLADFSDTRLLSFGSLFGSERVVLSSPEMQKFNQTIEDNQFLNLPLLEKISDQIADRLGGRGNYIGLHLRVANAFFKVQSPQIIRETFHKICKEILKLDQRIVDDLIARHESKAMLKVAYVEGGQEHLDSNLKTLSDNHQADSGNGLSDLDFPVYGNKNPKYGSKKTDQEASGRVRRGRLGPARTMRRASTAMAINRRPKPRFKCNGKLYDKADRQLEKLNVPIYISTDLPSKSVKTQEVLSIIFDTFPCVFSSKDIKALTPKDSKEALKSSNRGLAGLDNSSPKTSAQTRTKHDAREAISGKLDFSPYHDGQHEAGHGEEVQELYEFSQLKSNLDGVNLDRFLFPVLESMIVSKGSHIIGTPRSTFSSYVENVLHPAYQRSSKSLSSESTIDRKHTKLSS